MKYIFASFALGLITGFLLSQLIGIRPRIVYEETHIFKEPVVAKEGDNIWMYFELADEKVYGTTLTMPEDGELIQYNRIYTGD